MRKLTDLFLSTYLNKIDKKGRVSIPAPFRHIINSQAQTGIIVYQSIKHNCIEACTYARLKQIKSYIENLDPYSEERDAFETIMLGGSTQLLPDNEGRIVIPDYLRSYAELDTEVYFIGKGEVFEIWQPAKFTSYTAQAREIAMKNKLLLKNSREV